MKISQSLLPEFDHEMATTRRVLERVPEEKLTWKPHEKSMSFGALAVHVAEMAGWAKYTLEGESFDVAPPGAPPYQPPKVESTKQLLALFDGHVAATRAALEACPDSEMLKPWALFQGGQELFRQPRAGVIRGMIMNHIIHHRGQLSVYLRLNDIPVPSIYGPSADEGGGK